MQPSLAVHTAGWLRICNGNPKSLVTKGSVAAAALRRRRRGHGFSGRPKSELRSPKSSERLRIPCLIAFLREAAFPASVRGQVERLALARFAYSFRSEIGRLMGKTSSFCPRSDPVVLDDEILQVSARRAAAGVPWRPGR